MIKVIKPKPKTYRMECTRCDCEFEYELEDIQMEGQFIEVVICPECGEKNSHDYRKRIILGLDLGSDSGTILL